MIIYHGSTDIVESPRIIYSVKGRDFGSGFYTTEIKEQANKWAKRLSRIRKKENAFLNIYEFDIDSAYREVTVKSFDNYSMEWLDMVVVCRQDSEFRHEFDIVTGKIADDDVGETVQAVIDGLAPKEFALSKLIYMSANSQICFCTEKALSFVRYLRTERVE